jgi:hypothetical protein
MVRAADDDDVLARRGLELADDGAQRTCIAGECAADDSSSDAFQHHRNDRAALVGFGDEPRRDPVVAQKA